MSDTTRPAAGAADSATLAEDLSAEQIAGVRTAGGQSIQNAHRNIPGRAPAFEKCGATDMRRQRHRLYQAVQRVQRLCGGAGSRRPSACQCGMQEQ